MFRTLAAGCLVWLIACQNLEGPASATTPQLLVQAVMNAGTDMQVVIVSRTRTGLSATVSGGIGDNEPVLAAKVTVIAPNGTVMVASEHDSVCECAPGMYTIHPFSSGIDLRQGGTYTLHVRTTLGEEVSGATTIPVDTQRVIGVPGRVFLPAQDTLRLTWSRVPGARRYEVSIGRPLTAEHQIFTDTTITLPGNTLDPAGDSIFPVGPVEVLVSAVDVNYYDYYRAQSDPFAGAPPSHLTGAVGVFGSIVPILIAELQVR